MVTDAEQRDVLEKVYWFMTSKSKTIERLSKSRGYSADSAARILDSLGMSNILCKSIFGS